MVSCWQGLDQAAVKLPSSASFSVYTMAFLALKIRLKKKLMIRTMNVPQSDFVKLSSLNLTIQMHWVGDDPHGIISDLPERKGSDDFDASMWRPWTYFCEADWFSPPHLCADHQIALSEWFSSVLRSAKAALDSQESLASNRNARANTGWKLVATALQYKTRNLVPHLEKVISYHMIFSLYNDANWTHKTMMESWLPYISASMAFIETCHDAMHGLLESMHEL